MANYKERLSKLQNYRFHMFSCKNLELVLCVLNGAQMVLVCKQSSQ